MQRISTRRAGTCFTASGRAKRKSEAYLFGQHVEIVEPTGVVTAQEVLTGVSICHEKSRAELDAVSGRVS